MLGKDDVSALVAACLFGLCSHMARACVSLLFGSHSLCIVEKEWKEGVQLAMDYVVSPFAADEYWRAMSWASVHCTLAGPRHTSLRYLELITKMAVPLPATRLVIHSTVDDRSCIGTHDGSSHPVLSSSTQKPVGFMTRHYVGDPRVVSTCSSSDNETRDSEWSDTADTTDETDPRFSVESLFLSTHVQGSIAARGLSSSVTRPWNRASILSQVAHDAVVSVSTPGEYKEKLKQTASSRYTKWIDSDSFPIHVSQLDGRDPMSLRPPTTTTPATTAMGRVPAWYWWALRDATTAGYMCYSHMSDTWYDEPDNMLRRIFGITTPLGNECPPLTCYESQHLLDALWSSGLACANMHLLKLHFMWYSIQKCSSTSLAWVFEQFQLSQHALSDLWTAVVTDTDTLLQFPPWFRVSPSNVPVTTPNTIMSMWIEWVRCVSAPLRFTTLHTICRYWPTNVEFCQRYPTVQDITTYWENQDRRVANKRAKLNDTRQGADSIPVLVLTDAFNQPPSPTSDTADTDTDTNGDRDDDDDMTYDYPNESADVMSSGYAWSIDSGDALWLSIVKAFATLPIRVVHPHALASVPARPSTATQATQATFRDIRCDACARPCDQTHVHFSCAVCVYRECHVCNEFRAAGMVERSAATASISALLHVSSIVRDYCDVQTDEFCYMERCARLSAATVNSRRSKSPKCVPLVQDWWEGLYVKLVSQPTLAGRFIVRYLYELLPTMINSCTVTAAHVSSPVPLPLLGQLAPTLLFREHDRLHNQDHLTSIADAPSDRDTRQIVSATRVAVLHQIAVLINDHLGYRHVDLFCRLARRLYGCDALDIATIEFPWLLGAVFAGDIDLFDRIVANYSISAARLSALLSMPTFTHPTLDDMIESVASGNPVAQSRFRKMLSHLERVLGTGNVLSSRFRSLLEVDELWLACRL